ncbi:sensor histidine kinase, partial [Thiolapillus sp.]|uniref:sensor histidine kinase n=2 Tax=Thiolapillus sp. TaxID=2017437 RepID=UPI003AF746C8
RRTFGGIRHVHRFLLCREISGESLHGVRSGKQVWILGRLRCSEEAVLQADRELMSLLVHNLLGNAIKYGRQYAEISVSRDDGALRLEVLDDGPGISDSELPHLFERFYRGTVAKQQAQGNGLGLSIVKRIVELHGFRISAGRRTEGGLRVSLLTPEGSWAPA